MGNQDGDELGDEVGSGDIVGGGLVVGRLVGGELLVPQRHLWEAPSHVLVQPTSFHIPLPQPYIIAQSSLEEWEESFGSPGFQFVYDKGTPLHSQVPSVALSVAAKNASSSPAAITASAFSVALLMRAKLEPNSLHALGQSLAW